MTPNNIQLFATLFFALSVAHTFFTNYFQRYSNQAPQGSFKQHIFHFLGEIEFVFGLWALVFLIFFILSDASNLSGYLVSLSFTEPLFIFVIMTICSRKPIIILAIKLIEYLSKLLPYNRSLTFFTITLVLGPILGSLITEPAAMTVTALILQDRFFKKGISTQLMYATLGTLFVNVSVGGTLTPFAAPPILMVASKWNWGFLYMLTHFGWRGLLTVIVTTLLLTWKFENEISSVEQDITSTPTIIPNWLTIVHLAFLILVVIFGHNWFLFSSLFLLFILFVTYTQNYQEKIQFGLGSRVGVFLAGLVILGGLQHWWLEPILTKLNSYLLYMGVIALTAIIDNAALTYLGSQIPSLSELSKYFLVAGSVVGGGLTVIANAPNPAGYKILNPSFKEGGIRPFELFINALMPTLIALVCFVI